jgi:hypothetical protein
VAIVSRILKAKRANGIYCSPFVKSLVNNFDKNDV